MESVAAFLNNPSRAGAAFSFEMLPPLRGGSIDKTFEGIRPLLEMQPAYVNITTHRKEVSYRRYGDTTYSVHTAQRRPGTVAIAALLRERFGVRPVPHLISGDFTRQEIEDQLIDLSYLGITDLVVLRGDRDRDSAVFTTGDGGHSHASSLAGQVMEFNAGKMVDGSQAEPPAVPFTFGVAGYPEKHEEAMNLTTDIDWLKVKVDAGASYIVTQMTFDNSRFFDFVERCRRTGITVPIVPGIKPLTSLRQMSILPRVFHIDFPVDLARALTACRTDADVRELGVEWAVAQARELKEHGVPSIHFYALHAARSVERIARQIY